MFLPFFKNIFEYLILQFNNSILNFFRFIYKTFKIETLEDRYHLEKKDDNKKMNKVKFEFNNEDDYNKIKKNLLNIISDKTLLSKYNFTKDSILDHTNNKLNISFIDNSKSIYILFNHYYISGSTMFIFLNKIVNSNPPKFLQTNPFFGIIYLPFYFFDILSLEKIKYLKKDKQDVHLVIEKNIKTSNKRFYLYLNILHKTYKSLKMNRPMIAGLSVAFDELPYINNNVGLIIIKYEITDTIEILEKKIKNASYQAYVSNFILNCPLPNIYTFELREYLDCIISSMYLKSDLDFKFGWNCSKPIVEELYVGSVSILHSDNTMDINMVFNSSSFYYNNIYEHIENFFEE